MHSDRGLTLQVAQRKSSQPVKSNGNPSSVKAEPKLRVSSSTSGNIPTWRDALPSTFIIFESAIANALAVGTALPFTHTCEPKWRWMAAGWLDGRLDGCLPSWRAAGYGYGWLTGTN